MQIWPPKDESSFGVEALGHRDAATEAKEHAAEQLGTPPPQREAAVQTQAAPAARRSEAAQATQGNDRPCSGDAAATAVHKSPALAEPFRAALMDDSILEPPEERWRETPGVPWPDSLEADVSDPSRQYYEHARSAVERIVKGVPLQDALAALNTLATILKVWQPALGPVMPACRLTRLWNEGGLEFCFDAPCVGRE